uniref:Uncharacterized protein n=1 Tax=Acrobeloides nanus TaxID=290746 RepID=A0A914C4X5_9BILA
MFIEQHPIPEHVDRDTDGEPSAEIPRSVMLEKIQQHDDHDLVHVDGDPEHVDRNTNEERHLPSDEISHSVIPEKLQENADEKVSSGNVTAIELVNKLHEVFDTSNVQTSDGSAKASGVKITDNDAEVEPNDLEEFAQTDEEAICDAVTCNFEKENLCEWEASRDLLSPASRHYLKLKRMMHRNKRRTHYIQRTWHNWRGRYRNRVTGIARARVFSTANQHFAAAYVRPFQRATLTGKLLSREQETIRFRAWEATRNVQLRVCCDSTENCVFETDLGIKRGTRRWMVYQATCPAGTSKIIFECVNHGVYQGACGLDDIHLLNDYCPRLFPIDEQRKRRKVKFAS